MSTILVTGGNGQLARCIKKEAEDSRHQFIFFDKKCLDITDINAVKTLFEEIQPNFCVNCVGYTAVDKAEKEPLQAHRANADGPKNLADACKQNAVKLIHISTDFVFDGQKKTPYTENDVTNPLGVYGRTKLAGEQAIVESLEAHLIIRTSWLYSEYGHNFMKTILKLAKEKSVLRIVSDQKGTPTCGRDLAKVIIDVINKNTEKYGVYHYSNRGVATWYDFAKAIVGHLNVQCDIVPVKTSEYPAEALRPTFSVLDKKKIERVFNIQIPDWRDSLEYCLGLFNNTGMNR